MAKKRRGRGEGALFYSGAKGVWVARAVVGAKADGSPLRREVTAPTKLDALAKVRRLERDAQGGLAPEASAWTVSAYLLHWLEAVARPAVEPTTYETYERAVRVHLLPRLGAVRLDRLRAAHVEALGRDLRDAGLAGKTARNALQPLATALGHAVRTGLIPRSPAAGVPLPHVPDREVRPYAADEVRRLLAACRDCRHGVVFVLAVATGARLGELLALGWADVDLAVPAVRVERSLCLVGGAFQIKSPKSKRGRRTIDLPAFAAEALAGLPRRDGLLFHADSGNYLNHANVWRAWQAVQGRAGVEPRGVHHLRHTHASQLLADGVPLLEVARRLGDRPETVLACYGHYMPTNVGVPARLDALYGAG